MTSVRPARPSEVSEICTFLVTHMDPSVSRERFYNLFTYPWMADKPNLGFVLEDEGRLVGFLSTIYADREIGGAPVRFCNLSSWFVLPEYRNHSLALLAAAHRQADLVFTNLTSRPAVRKISLALRYQLLDTYKLFAFPFAQFWTLGRMPRVLFQRDAIEPLLPPAQQKLLRDHAATPCGHLLIRRRGQSCYIIWIRRVKKGIPFCELLYVSAPELLRDCFEPVKLALCLRSRAPAVAIDERLLGARLPLLYAFERISLFKSNRVGPADIDNLYSELALL